MSAFVTATALALAREFAPSLIGRLTGQRGGEVAQAIIETATRAAEVKRGASAEATVQEIKADPDKAAAVQVELQALERREYELEVADRISAREYRASLTPRERERGSRLLWTNIALLVLTIGVLAFLEATDRLDQNGMVFAFLMTAGGTFLANFKDAHGFEFGSSRGSKEKDEERRRAQERREEGSAPAPAPMPAPEPEIAAPAPPPTPIEPVAPRSRDFVGELMEMA